jgi:hypothetical protein
VTDAGPTRRDVLAALAEADALPIKTELDYYTADAETYTAAIRELTAFGWLVDVAVQRETLSGGQSYETFAVAGIEFVSPRGVTPLTDRPAMPIEKLDGAVTIVVDGHSAEITGPIAEGLRAAVYAAARGPLPSRDESCDSNVVQLGVHGRGRLVAPHREGA